MGLAAAHMNSSASHTEARITWHLGFQKTGTTSFQSVCWRNMGVLSEFVALFPKKRWTEELRTASQAFLEGKATESDVEAAAEKIASEVRTSGHTRAVVSDENLLGIDVYNGNGTIIDFAMALIPVLERAVRPLVSEFVFYTRAMESWLQSAHAQAIAWGRMREDYDVWRAAVPFETDWDALHQRLQSVTDAPVVFRDMKQDLKEGRMLGAYLFDRGGVAQDVQDGLTPARSGNERLPQSVQAFLLELNRSKLNDRQLNIVRRQVMANQHLFAPNGEG